MQHGQTSPARRLLAEKVFPPSFDIVPAPSGPDFQAALAIRRRVFVDEQRIVESNVADPDDARSLVVLAHRRNPHLNVERPDPIGTGRLTLRFGTHGEALVAWVATLPECRGRGIGTALVRYLLHAADAGNAPAVVLAAQLHAERFYRRLGFVPNGEVYTVRGIAHRWMRRPGR